MAYLPPTQVEQVSSLWAILADPNKYKALMDTIVKADDALDARKQELSVMFDAHRANLRELTAREDLLDEQTRALQSEVFTYNQRLTNLQSREQSLAESISAHNSETATKQNFLDQLSNDLSLDATVLAAKAKTIAERETSLSTAEAKCSSLQKELEDKLAKLKAIV